MKDAVQAVVVLGADRVELVVVAAGARQRQTEECSPHIVDRVLNGEMRRIVIDARTKPPREGDVRPPAGNNLPIEA